ncbi:serine/threonine-protein kinase [Akkermansiaceae bacterium]|nr:serine/threonine-protein kinase [Akkermansiaceae bacterium]
MPIAELSDGRTIEFVHSDSPPEGGMKKVYFSTDRKHALCFFKDENAGNDANRISRLESIIGRFNPTITRADGGAAPSQQSADYFKNLFCWPTAIIVKPQFGILTPIYQSNFFFSKGRFKGKDKQGLWFSSPKLRKLIPPEEVGDWLGHLSLCTRMARGVAKMHMTGLAHSDLSANNVLVDPSSGSCAVIDIDSLVVPGRFPPDVLGTPGYIAPEVLSSLHLSPDDPQRVLPCNWTDLHALAVLIYEYLLKRHPLRGPKVNSATSSEDDEHLSMGSKAVFIEHPTDHSNRPGKKAKDPSWRGELEVTINDLGPYLSKCFKETFVAGLHVPRLRVVASTWVDSLCKTQDLIMRCENSACSERWYVYNEGRHVGCPWCGNKPRRETPILDLHYAPRPGQFRPQNHSVVAWDKRTLHEWHVYSNKRMDENSDPTGLADVQFYNGQWILINRELDSMVSPSGNPVPKGQAVVLKEGDEILLSKSEKGRLISVRMIK